MSGLPLVMPGLHRHPDKIDFAPYCPVALDSGSKAGVTKKNVMPGLIRP
jgi:hypothetical protein